MTKRNAIPLFPIPVAVLIGLVILAAGPIAGWAVGAVVAKIAAAPVGGWLVGLFVTAFWWGFLIAFMLKGGGE